MARLIENRARAAVLLVVGVALTYGVTVVSLAGVARHSAPNAVLKWYGSDAQALEELAEAPPEKLSNTQAAQTLAEAALRRSPLSAKAARVLAALYSVKEQQAKSDRLALFAAALSHRDLPTQLFLIERGARRNDVAGAIEHYDIALRTSRGAANLLLPTLVTASEHPDVVNALIPILRKDPPWREPFLWLLLSQGKNFASVSLLVREFADLDDATGASMLRTLVSRSVDEKRYAQAFETYRRITGQHGNGLIDGDFNSEPRFSPVEWQLSDDANLRAVVEQMPGANGRALSLHSGEGRGGEIARQLIGLPAGKYAITAIVGDVAMTNDERPVLSLRCATTDATFAQVRFPTAPEQGSTLRATASIPRECAAQWISIQIASAFDESDRDPWIDSIKIVRVDR